MTTAARTHDTPPPTFRVHTIRPWVRAIAGALFAIGRGSLPVILVLVVLATDPPIMPSVLVRLVVELAVVPGLLAGLIGRATLAVAEVRDGALVLRRRGLVVEVPCAAIADVVPWTVPLPGPGFTLRLRSGRALRYGIGVEDPTPLLQALGELCGVAGAARAAEHPSVVYARARAAAGVRRWYHVVARFPFFALLPTAVLFNVHQHIAYGALLGEYYLLGLRSWLTTLAVYWATVTVYVVLYASVWRGLVELASLVAAGVAPSRAARVRRAAEITAQVLYYAGVPVLLGIRFLPW